MGGKYSAYLFECEHVLKFWGEVESLLFNNCNIRVTLTPEMVILGIITNDNLAFTKNYLIILGKKYIYDCRRLQSLPNIRQFTIWVQERITIEKHKYKLQRFDKKDTDLRWTNLCQFCR